MAIKYLNWAWGQNLKTPLQKLVLLKLGDNADDSGTAFPSIDLIAKFTCANEKTVRNNLKALEELGLITIYKAPSRTGYQRNKYKLHFEVVLHYENNIPKTNEPATDAGTNAVTDAGTQRNQMPTNPQSIPQVINPQNNGSSNDKPNEYPDEFESVWERYPKREGSNPKKDAYSSWKARLKQGHTVEAMASGVERYGFYIQEKGQLNTNFVMQAKRFFGPGCEFENAWQVTTTPNRGNSQPLDLDSKDWADDIGKIL